MKNWICIACITLLVLARAACGQCTNGSISVTFVPTNGGSCSITFHSGTGKYNVSVVRNAAVTQTVVVNIRGASSDNLHAVNIDTSSVWTTWVSIGTPASRFATVDAVTRTGAGSDVVLLDLYTTGHLGVNLSTSPSVELDQINDVFVGGDVLSPVVASSGNLSLLNVAASIYGDVRVPNGYIDEIACTGNLSTIDVLAQDGIHAINSAANYATIDTKYNSGNGNLWQLTTTSGGFFGSLNAASIENPNGPVSLSIAGDLNAPITLSGSLLSDLEVIGNVDAAIDIAGDLDSDATITIGQALRDDVSHSGSISVGSVALAGQIIINAGNATSNAWQGPITVGSTTLSTSPSYSNLSASLGGGAVGLVPYALHDEDCAPENGDSPSMPFDDDFRIRFYGPVTWDTGTPVKFQMVALVNGQIPSSPSWTDITKTFWDVSHENYGRDLVITRNGLDYATGYAYRVIPVLEGTSRLKCDGTTASTPPSVEDFEYVVLFP